MFCALLPDGRLWAGTTDQSWPDRQQPKNLAGRFVGGSNWVEVADDRESTVVRKSDGTLWKLSPRDGPGQIGSDSDWKKVVGGNGFFLALKRDGTVWGWGAEAQGILPEIPDKKGRDNIFSQPVQLWPDSDWVDVFAAGQPRAVKRDGSFWTWGYDGSPVKGIITNYSIYHRLGIQLTPPTATGSILTCDGRLPERPDGI